MIVVRGVSLFGLYISRSTIVLCCFAFLTRGEPDQLDLFVSMHPFGNVSPEVVVVAVVHFFDCVPSGQGRW